ncbi:methionine gamma-lyase [Hypericibacter adhaerens]|jgi:methionine-gamma-lyase|uniref:L-methionine gamma-lyase n=1 Tax=Hypericibacter adhaerens TaxID=2602016 RepID=A0A5J6N5B6_9PROT|nr:methionine gamma-lyase [Hypericibacter adhaerens]QEX22126.1 methionine gamma-lyase [Hypericibacter adhaerens]
MRQNTRNAPAGFATRAIHLGYEPASEHGALTPPIFMTSTYAFESAEAGAELFRGERAGYIYGRNRNPTQALLEERIASLEGGEAALAVASGMGAIASLLWTLLSAGDEVVIDHTIYGSSFALLTKGLTRFGIAVHPVDMTRLETLEAALTPKTKLVFFETPANPNLRVIDIAAVAERAHAAGALAVVDSTFCSPAIQRPLQFGADLVVHSATKYLGGHGDLLGGLVVGPAETIKQIRTVGLRWLTGATLSPINAFLILRGLKTLELRMERHCASASALAELLASHPAVARVSYPGLASFPQYALAKRQMSLPGGLIAFELEGGVAAGTALMNRLELITRAVSLGDAETLIQHPASMTHSTYSAEERQKHGISDGLVRLSVGLETLDDLVNDLAQALDSLRA